MAQKYTPVIGLIIVISTFWLVNGIGPVWAEAPQSAQKTDGGAGHSQAKEPTRDIRLNQALALALARNPALSAFSKEIRARDAQALQEGLLPNPEMSFEIDEWGGSSDRTSFDAAETMLRFDQLVELGGKRAKRKKVAIMERNLGEWDFRSKRLDILQSTTKAFVDTLAAQQRSQLARETFGLAQQIFQVVSERVKAGKTSPVEKNKASVELSKANVELQRTRYEMKAAEKRLASEWGGEPDEFSSVTGNLEAPTDIPALADLLKQTRNNPDIARWDAEMDFRNSALELAKARRFPDVTVGAGVKRFEVNDEMAAVAGFSIPLPIFDRNQGNIRAARERITKAKDDRAMAVILVEKELSETYQALSSFHEQVEALKNEILPASKSVFESTREGFQQGKFQFLDVLDAQRTFFDAEFQYIEALQNYHKALADVDRLIGTDLDNLSIQSEQKEPGNVH